MSINPIMNGLWAAVVWALPRSTVVQPRVGQNGKTSVGNTITTGAFSWVSFDLERRAGIVETCAILMTSVPLDGEGRAQRKMQSGHLEIFNKGTICATENDQPRPATSMHCCSREFEDAYMLEGSCIHDPKSN